MKRLLVFLCLLLIPCLGALAEEPFAIDQAHAYPGMDRPISQGYAPGAAGNTMTVLLPLTTQAVTGEITATLTPADVKIAPFKLQGLEKTFLPKEYRFGQDRISAYLVSFSLALYPDRMNGEYPVSITVSGSDDKGRAVTQVFPLEIAVTGGWEDGQAPRAQVESLALGGALAGKSEAGDSYAIAGEAGELRLMIRNESQRRAIQDIDVTFSDPLGDVLPQAADTVRLTRLAPGESALCALPVKIAQQAAARPHQVEVTVAFTYAGGRTGASSIKYTLDIRQTARLAYTQAALPPRVTQGDVPAFSMTLMNMGKSVLHNVLLTFDVPGLSSGGSVLAGTIGPGESKTASTNFRVDGAILGDTQGTLTISYEDAYGEYHQTQLPLQTLIEKKVVQTFAQTEAGQEQEQKKGLPQWIPYAALGVAVVLLVVQRALLLQKIHALEEKNL